MKFEISGLNHIALVCQDMQRTVDFYTNILGFKLVKTIDLPGGLGQHFFFDFGGRQCIAFFWFTDAGERVPGVSNPRQLVDPAEFHQDPTAWISSHGSMNHFAFDVAPDKIDAYRQNLIDAGVTVSDMMHHDNSPGQAAESVNDGVWVSSVYFLDPDGIMLEFAAWQRPFSAHQGDHWDNVPARPEDVACYRAIAEEAMHEEVAAT